MAADLEAVRRDAGVERHREADVLRQRNGQRSGTSPRKSVAHAAGEHKAAVKSKDALLIAVTGLGLACSPSVPLTLLRRNRSSSGRAMLSACRCSETWRRWCVGLRRQSHCRRASSGPLRSGSGLTKSGSKLASPRVCAQLAFPRETRRRAPSSLDLTAALCSPA